MLWRPCELGQSVSVMCICSMSGQIPSQNMRASSAIDINEAFMAAISAYGVDDYTNDCLKDWKLNGNLVERPIPD